MSLLFAYARRHVWGFLLSIGVLSLETLGDLLQPTLMARIIDQGVARQDMGLVLKVGGLMLLVTAFGATAAVIRNLVSSRVSQTIGNEIRSDLFRKIQAFRVPDLDRFETASLVTRLTQDVGQVQNFLHGLMRIFVKAPLMAIGSVVLSISLSPSLSLIVIAIIPLVAVLIVLNLKIGYPLFMKVQGAMDRMGGILREYLSGIRVVKAYGRFDHEGQRFQKANDDMADISLRTARTMAFFGPMTALVVNLGIVAVLWYGGFLAGKGRMEVGKILAFIQYMTQLLFSLMMVSFVFQTFARARASATRIQEVHAVATGDFPKPAALTARPTRGASLAFEGVSFAYDSAPHLPVLTGVNFSVEPGGTVGIIGSTGSGKTSLAHLVPGLQVPTSGRILFGGLELDRIPREIRQARIALVPQKVTLFTGTIGENLRWGKADATEEDLIRAARLAQAHDFIAAFPEGYGTVLGQGGVNLSGGQKQRLCIARALVREPDLLILDDAVSAVDTATENRIREGLASLGGGVTTLLIAQRITSVMNCATIVVLEEGRVAGTGTHRELLDGCEVYRDIFRSQIDRHLPPAGGAP